MEKFIKKAKDIHGDKYDYSLVDYNDMKTNVLINCKYHGTFKIRPEFHIYRKQGCKICDNNKKHNMRVNRLIEKAKEAHGDKYGYSLVDFLDPIDKVKLICPKHGIFIQRFSDHIYKKCGCRKCSNQKLKEMYQKDTQSFIEKAKETHGDKYDYSLVDYNGSKSKVKIICPEHGVFEQNANNHIFSKNICPKCAYICRGNDKKYDTQKFIKKAIEIHGDKYDYSLVDYKDSQKKVKIICPEHGEFEQKPNTHLNGSGCFKCGQNTCRKSKIYNYDFIKKAKDIHGDKYDYSLVDYCGINECVDIICDIHGIFKQTPHSHIKGSGCSKCGNQFSLQHETIKLFLIQHNIKFEENTRSLIPPLELDFYLPDHNIAIEINGIYWHSELRGKDKNYHLNKTTLCKEKGIKLLHINENEFINSPRIVISKLKSILNISKRKIHGRNCEVREIDTKLKSKFLNKYHLQGNDKASVKLGLFYKDRLVSVMTFCKRRIAMGKKSSEEGEYELSRYCGNFNFYAIGGASKMMKYFERNYKPSKIVTYADKRWSTGDLYFKLGFTHTHDSKPNYWYFQKSDKLYHRFNFRKSELPKKLEAFDPNKTEWQNMKDNGWDRIWDCGNMVFELIL
jgi:very-short-patch-repair endonuclease